MQLQSSSRGTWGTINIRLNHGLISVNQGKVKAVVPLLYVVYVDSIEIRKAEITAYYILIFKKFKSAYPTDQSKWVDALMDP